MNKSIIVLVVVVIIAIVAFTQFYKPPETVDEFEKGAEQIKTIWIENNVPLTLLNGETGLSEVKKEDLQALKNDLTDYENNNISSDEAVNDLVELHIEVVETFILSKGVEEAMDQYFALEEPNVCDNLGLALELKDGYLQLIEKAKELDEKITSFKETHPERASNELIPSYDFSSADFSEARATIIEEFNEEIAKC